MVRYEYLIGLLALLFIAPAVATNTTMNYYCPKIACVGSDFLVYADYKYNGTTIALSDVSAGGYTLNYNFTTDRYEDYFTSATPTVWNYTIWANNTNITYTNMSANCSTEVLTCFNLTVEIWQEQELRTVANTSDYIVTERNYDKQLNRRYLNEFAWVVAQNLDQNGSEAYEYCNVPFGSGQSLTGLLNFMNWMGDKSTHNLTHSILGRLIGCESFWFRAKYVNGRAVIALPYAGNYSLSMIDGTMDWENDVSPPKITKSNLYLPLGAVDLPTKNNFTATFWVSHAELDWWGSLIANMYLILVTLIPFIIFVVLIVFGASARAALGIVLIWIILWTILRLL